MYRKSHQLRIIACQHIAEVSGRHTEINLITERNALFLNQTLIRIEIINDLRNQTTDIDGIRTGENNVILFKPIFKHFIMEYTLYTALCIIKVALDCDNIGVFSLLGHHLQTLYFTDTVIGIKHCNTDIIDILKTGQCSFARITARRC